MGWDSIRIFLAVALWLCGKYSLRMAVKSDSIAVLKTALELGRWFKAQHDKANEIWVAQLSRHQKFHG